MSALELAVTRLQLNEGFRAAKYVDSRGFDTIGYGFNLSAGITPYAATQLLSAQARELSWALKPYEWFSSLDDVRASVLIELAFNLGVSGLKKFTQFLAALTAKDWPTAKAQLLDSDAAREAPKRYGELAELVGPQEVSSA